MISVSEDFKNLMQSNIRPKIQPIITLKGIDNAGNDVQIQWTASQIKDVKFKRGFDPTGNELPYIELKWTEVYNDKLNAEAYPSKYSNITSLMSVQLEWEQYLDFFTKWKHLMQTSWGALFGKQQTWKFKPAFEKVKMPMLFLTARPEIKNNTVTWIARDFLYFLNEPVRKSFNYIYTQDVLLFKNPILYLLVSARQQFLRNDEFFQIMTESINLINEDYLFEKEMLDKSILLEGEIKNLLKNYSAIHSHWLNFDEKGRLIFCKLFDNEIRAHFSKHTMYKYPYVTKNYDIKEYQFKRYGLQENSQKQYSSNAPEKILYYQFGETAEESAIIGYQYRFDDLGRTVETANENQVYSEVDYCIQAGVPNGVNIIPLFITTTDEKLTNSTLNSGEIFNENNKINPYESIDFWAIDRFEFLKKYFNKNRLSFKFETLANVAIEAGDLIKLDTNMFDAEGNQIQKNAIVTSLEIVYNGVAKAKITAHEIGG